MKTEQTGSTPAFAEGAQVNYGYRAILNNLRFESGLTVREVFGGAHRAKWVALGKARRAIDGQALANVQAVLEALLADSGGAVQDSANGCLCAAASARCVSL